MKNSTLWSLALVALTLVSQGLRAQDCQFTPDLFPGQAADRTAHEVSATVHVGECGQYLTHLHSQVVNLTSTNQQIVRTTNEGGYDCVFFNGVGQADVTYTENWFVGSASGGGAEGGTTTIIGGDGSVIGGNGSAGGDGGESGSSVCPSNHTIHYTVLPGTPVARFLAGRDEVITEMHVAQGGGWSQPYLELIIKELQTVNNYLQFVDMYISASQCTFTSSDESVATIGRGNNVMLTNNLGHTTITATWAGSELWNGVTLSYELYVEAPKNQAYITFSPNMNYVDTVGNTLNVQPTIYPEGAPIYVQRWLSTNTNVATVDNSGNVTMLAPGTTKIYAIFDGNDDYYETQGYYDLTVVKGTPDIHFSAEVATVELGLPYTLPTIINNSGVTINKYYGSNSNVAQVNEATGEVTIVGEGDAQIYCETYGNNIYNPAIVSYTLHVFTYGIKVKGINVTSQNADDVLGDGSHEVTFDLEKRFLHLNGWNIDVTALAADIKAGVIKVEGQHVAYIVAHGINSIVGAQYGLMSEGGAIAVMGEGKDDQLNILAYDKAVNAHDFKLHQVSMHAEGNQYGLYLTNSLGISTGTYLHALGQTQAIACNSFIKAEDTEDGKGIEILTPNVIFKHGAGQNLGGFMLVEGVNYSPAKDVEIGKAPVVVPDNKVTTIDFTQTDPEGNESVIFNATAENTFNEETGQLEISTSLTDEQVATALETLIPGSSAWLDLLPGSLTFDIPAGEGDIKVQCMTLGGYELKLKIEGEASVSITQAELGWATVHYNVANPVHVVIYLHANGGSTAPARIATRMEDAVTAGAYIQAVTIQPANAPLQPTAIDQVVTPSNGSEKILCNGQLLILRDGKIFNAQGAQVR